MRRVALFYSFTNAFSVWFHRRALDSHSASAFSLMQGVVLVEYLRKIQPWVDMQFENKG